MGVEDGHLGLGEVGEGVYAVADEFVVLLVLALVDDFEDRADEFLVEVDVFLFHRVDIIEKLDQALNGLDSDLFVLVLDGLAEEGVEIAVEGFEGISCIFKDESKEFESSSSDLDIVIEISLLSDNLVKLRPLSITESENGDASYEVGYRVSDDLRLFIEESLDEDHFELLLRRLIKSLIEFNHISLEQNSGEVSETLIWIL